MKHKLLGSLLVVLALAVAFSCGPGNGLLPPYKGNSFMTVAPAAPTDVDATTGVYVGLRGTVRDSETSDPVPKIGVELIYSVKPQVGVLNGGSVCITGDDDTICGYYGSVTATTNFNGNMSAILTIPPGFAGTIDIIYSLPNFEEMVTITAKSAGVLLPTCADNIDNDADTYIDFGPDLGCSSQTDTTEYDDTGVMICDNNIDEDGDGFTDMADPGCSNPFTDNSEYGTNQCDDGIDNDGDTKCDSTPHASCLDASTPGDPTCTTVTGTAEAGTTACDNGIDDDSDGLVDYNATPGVGDPGCTSFADNDEKGTTECDNAFDDDNDGLTDYNSNPGLSDPGCTGPADASELGTNACDDGVDNDGDTLCDSAGHTCSGGAVSPDPSCTSPAGTSEYECSDGFDNDGDTLIDFAQDTVAASTAGNGCTALTDDTE